MFEQLRAYLERGVPITDEQFDFIKTQFIPKKVKKNEFLIREGEIAKYRIAHKYVQR
jgi:CRP/FNR family transcriptional regulator, anaerobic regulatory protein